MKNNKNISLNEIGNRLPFTVPDNYFEQFALNIESKTQEATGHTIKRLLKPWMYIAAAFVGVLLLTRVSYTVYNTAQDKNNENYEMYIMSQLDESVVYDYYVNNEK